MGENATNIGRSKGYTERNKVEGEEGGRRGKKKREGRQKRRERRLLLSPQDPLVSKISSPRFHVEFSSCKFLWKNADFHSIH